MTPSNMIRVTSCLCEKDGKPLREALPEQSPKYKD